MTAGAVERRYLDGSAVLETVFSTPEGVFRLTDLMPKTVKDAPCQEVVHTGDEIEMIDDVHALVHVSQSLVGAGSGIPVGMTNTFLLEMEGSTRAFFASGDTAQLNQGVEAVRENLEACEAAVWIIKV